MGIPWDGTGINCYWNGTDKYVPWTTVRIRTTASGFFHHFVRQLRVAYFM